MGSFGDIAPEPVKLFRARIVRPSTPIIDIPPIPPTPVEPQMSAMDPMMDIIPLTVEPFMPIRPVRPPPPPPPPPKKSNISSSSFSIYIPLASEEENDAPVLGGPSKFQCSRVGRFAHPNSCEKYYFCWDTIHDHAEFNCPYHEAFNPKIQQCGIDFSVCDAAPKCYFDGQLLPNVEDNTTFFECRFMKRFSSEDEGKSSNQYRLYKELCDNGGEFDANLGYCKLTTEDEDDDDDSSESDESIKKVECNEAGVFIDHSDESRYYECIPKNVTYAKIHQSCPNNYVFSMADKRCIKLGTERF